MPVLVGFQASRPASSFVSWDTDAAPKSGTFHTRDRYIELCKLLRYPKGFSASKGIVDIFGGASRPSSLGGETVQVRSIPLVDVSETSQRLDEVSRYQPQNQALTDKKIKILQSGTGFPCWLSSHSFYPGIKSHGWN